MKLYFLNVENMHRYSKYFNGELIDVNYDDENFAIDSNLKPWHHVCEGSLKTIGSIIVGGSGYHHHLAAAQLSKLVEETSQPHLTYIHVDAHTDFMLPSSSKITFANFVDFIISGYEELNSLILGVDKMLDGVNINASNAKRVEIYVGKNYRKRSCIYVRNHQETDKIFEFLSSNSSIDDVKKGNSDSQLLEIRWKGIDEFINEYKRERKEGKAILSIDLDVLKTHPHHFDTLLYDKPASWRGSLSIEELETILKHVFRDYEVISVHVCGFEDEHVFSRYFPYKKKNKKSNLDDLKNVLDILDEIFR